MIGPQVPALGAAVIEVAVGCLFLHAAAAKALHPAAARSALRVLGVSGGSWPLRGVVGIEAALGLALCAGWRLELAAPAAVGLLAVFSGGLVVLRLRGYEGECGCGAASTLLPLPPELRNVLLIAVLMAATIVRPEAGGPLGGGTRSALAALLLASIVVVSTLVEGQRDRFLREQWEV